MNPMLEETMPNSWWRLFQLSLFFSLYILQHLISSHQAFAVFTVFFFFSFFLRKQQ